jgi:hypothetical protein
MCVGAWGLKQWRGNAHIAVWGILQVLCMRATRMDIVSDCKLQYSYTATPFRPQKNITMGYWFLADLHIWNTQTPTTSRRMCDFYLMKPQLNNMTNLNQLTWTRAILHVLG